MSLEVMSPVLSIIIIVTVSEVIMSNVITGIVVLSKIL